SYAYFPGPSDRLQTPQISYSVKFKAADIWGEQMSEPGCFIYADIFECYLK
ncbi:MAG: SH3-like domain-containing protein, partial [bacterium]